MPLQRSGPPPRRTPLVARSQLARGGPLARTSGLNGGRVALRSGGPLPAVSDRRRAENRDRRVMVAGMVGEVLERGLAHCAAATVLPAIPCGGPTDAHELLSRARGGSIVDPANVVLICRRHHEHVTTEPLVAERVRLALPSWAATTGGGSGKTAGQPAVPP